MSQQGYLASMDGYTHRFSLITEEVENKVTIVDSVVENFKDVCRLLSICHNAGLVVNSDKFQFCQETVESAGLDVTMEGVKHCKKFLESIKQLL